MFKFTTQLIAYRGFGNNSKGYVMGHFFYKKITARSKLSKNPLINLWEMAKRYLVKMYGGKELILTIGAKQYHVVTRFDGFFELDFDTTGLDQGNHKYWVRSAEDPLICDHNIIFIGNPDTLVVSDIDDTILVSHSNVFPKKMLLFTKNPECRRYLKSTKKLYEKIIIGERNHMMFYVSSSEWNLYDFITHFFRFHSLKPGAFLLRDIKRNWMELLISGSGNHQHKKEKIEFLLSFFPGTMFILVGDSCQQDLDIYTQLALQYSNRVKKIYIRTVSKGDHRKLVCNFKQLQESSVAVESFS